MIKDDACKSQFMLCTFFVVLRTILTFKNFFL